MNRLPFLAFTAAVLFAAPAVAADPVPLNWNQMVRPAVETHAFEWALVALSFVVLAIALERAYALGLHRNTFLPATVGRIAAQARQTPAELVPLLRQATRDHAGPYPVVLSHVLDRAGEPFAVLAAARDAAVEVEEDRVGQPTAYLMLIAKLSPFLGLIGTVCGIMVALDSPGDESRNAVVSSGLSTALASTALGILVAAFATAVAVVSRQQSHSLFKRLSASVGDFLPKLSGKTSA